MTYLILAGENNHYGGISLDGKKNSRVVTQPRTSLERKTDSTQRNKTNKLVGHSTSPLIIFHTGHNPPKERSKRDNSTSKEEGQNPKTSVETNKRKRKLPVLLRASSLLLGTLRLSPSSPSQSETFCKRRVYVGVRLREKGEI